MRGIAHFRVAAPCCQPGRPARARRATGPWVAGAGAPLAVTHSGVTVAPVLGRLVAREVADGEPDGLLAPFRPGRFAERASRVLLEVESVFRERPRQRPSR
jgi:hypothetical protein